MENLEIVLDRLSKSNFRSKIHLNKKIEVGDWHE